MLVTLAPWDKLEGEDLEEFNNVLGQLGEIIERSWSGNDGRE